MTRSARKPSYELRPRQDGSFDELIVRDRKDNCIVYAEMMDRKTLWIGIYPPGEPWRAVMWIKASRGKLNITTDEENL